MGAENLGGCGSRSQALAWERAGEALRELATAQRAEAARIVAAAAQQSAEAGAAAEEGRERLAQLQRDCDERAAGIDSEAAELDAKIEEAAAPVAQLCERLAFDHATAVARVADLR